VRKHPHVFEAERLNFDEPTMTSGASSETSPSADRVGETS
jgi:hypothetical protein